MQNFVFHFIFNILLYIKTIFKHLCIVLKIAKQIIAINISYFDYVPVRQNLKRKKPNDLHRKKFTQQIKAVKSK